MSRRDIDLLLQDMRESVGKILKNTEGLFYDDFLRDDKTIDVVLGWSRNFKMI